MPELGGCIAGFGLGGGSSFGGQGTRGVPFQKQQEQDSSGATGGAKQTVYYNSISAMPQYNSKSHEELRWEDYQVYVQPVTSPSHFICVSFLSLGDLCILRSISLPACGDEFTCTLMSMRKLLFSNLLAIAKELLEHNSDFA